MRPPVRHGMSVQSLQVEESKSAEGQEKVQRSLNGSECSAHRDYRSGIGRSTCSLSGDGVTCVTATEICKPRQSSLGGYYGEIMKVKSTMTVTIAIK
jgi:hypothetical protein